MFFYFYKKKKVALHVAMLLLNIKKALKHKEMVYNIVKEIFQLLIETLLRGC
jgi:hypothetical protein